MEAGDSLWEIARAHDTSVEALKEENNLGAIVIFPGQILGIPSGG